MRIIRSIKIDIPQGCESGKIIEIANKGIPILTANGNINGHGNLKVKINVKIPKFITHEQRVIFEKLKNVIWNMKWKLNLIEY